MKSSLLAPIAAAVMAADVHAQTPAPQAAATPVAVIVKVPKPWYAPKAVVVGKMRDTIPQYENLAGLNYKMFSFAQADGHFGGIYLWQGRAVAQAWFNPAWFERVRRERGVEGNVRTFEVPVWLDNVRPGMTGNETENIATPVTIPVPPNVGRARLIEEFRAAVPLYQKIAGLKRKYFVITDDGRFGGIYLWESRAAADQWFSTAWDERVRKTYGTEAALEWFDTPILLPSKLADNRIDMARP